MPDRLSVSAEDVPTRVVEPATQDCQAAELCGLNPVHYCRCRSALTTALREYERLGYRLVRDDEAMRWRGALEVVRSALAGDHRSAGSACGVDACVLVLGADGSDRRPHRRTGEGEDRG